MSTIKSCLLLHTLCLCLTLCGYVPSIIDISFSGWYIGNFAHFIHDHASKIAWLRQHFMNHDEHTKIILPYHEVHKAVLAVIDQDFVRNRVLWINYEQTISAQSSSLIVMRPKSNAPFLSGFPQTATVYTESLRRWLQESHWMPSSPNAQVINKRRVIYYTRWGGAMRRQMNKELESQVLFKTRDAMKKRGQNPEEDLIIFNGQDESGNTMAVQA